MLSQASRVDVRLLGSAGLVLVLASGVGLFVGHAPLQIPFLLIAALLVAAAAFLRTELAIHMLILSMLLSPEFSPGGTLGGSGLESSRSAVIRIEDLLLVVIGGAWLAKMAVFKQLGAITRTALNWPIGLYALALSASTLLGMAAGRVSSKVGPLYLGKYLEYFVIYFLVVSYTRDRRAMNRMLITAGITALIVALVAMAQIPGGGRVSAPFEGERGEPNTLGGYLVLMMAVLGGIALEAQRRRDRLWLGGLVALLGVPLLYTLSRSSWMAAAAAGVGLLFATRERRRLLIVGLLAVTIGWIFLPASVVERVGYTFTPHRTSVHVGQVALDASASERVRSWGETLEDAAEHPLLGYGVTGYHFIDAQYFRVLIESGVLGLIAFVVMVFMVLRNARRGCRLRDPTLRGMSAGFLAAACGLLVHAIGANTFIIVRIMEPFWLFAGLVVVAPLLDRSDEVADEPA